MYLRNTYSSICLYIPQTVMYGVVPRSKLFGWDPCENFSEHARPMNPKKDPAESTIQALTPWKDFLDVKLREYSFQQQPYSN